MPVCKNLSELEAYIQEKINESLIDDVAKAVSEKLNENIDESVYKMYTPTLYNRRGELGDINNIESEIISTGVLSIQNIAVSNNSLKTGKPYYHYGVTSFARLINDGLVPNIFNDKYYSWMTPARFMEDTYIDVSAGRIHIKALKKGLIKRGLKVKG